MQEQQKNIPRANYSSWIGAIILFIRLFIIALFTMRFCINKDQEIFPDVSSNVQQKEEELPCELIELLESQMAKLELVELKEGTVATIKEEKMEYNPAR